MARSPAHEPEVRSARASLALGIATCTLAAVVVALRSSPSRLAVNAIGLALVGGALWWVVQRRAGIQGAALVSAVSALFVAYLSLQDYRVPPAPSAAPPLATASRWTVGWPTSQWILAHEIALSEPWDGGPATFAVQRYGPHEGPSHVLASVNGVELGPMRAGAFDVLEVDAPDSVLRGQDLVRFELRLDGDDQHLRLVAQRWAAGATRGNLASSYFDGRAWHGGTFDDARGRGEAGIYVVDLKRQA